MFSQYKYSKNLIVDKYTNHYYSQSLHIREKIRILLDKVQYDFKNVESQNIKKLDELYQIYKDTKVNFNSIEAAKLLNKNVEFGKYQVFLINKDNIVEKSSYSNDIGLDLGQFKYIKVLFDSLYTKKINIDISVPILDTLSMSLKKYLIKLSDDDEYILQIAFVIDFKEILKEIYKDNSIHTENMNIYFATQFSFQKVEFGNTKFKKYSLKEHIKNTKIFFTTINQYIQDKEIRKMINLYIEKEDVDYNYGISKIFKNEDKLLYFLNKKENLVHYYSVTQGVFNIKDELKIVVNLDFSTQKLNLDIDDIFNHFLLIVSLMLIILFLLYLFFLFNISNKLIELHNNIKNNKNYAEKNTIVSEIYELTESYNQLHSSLNKQIEINKNLSYIDSLTHIKNRKAYDEKILEVLTLFRRFKTPFAIAMLDIDNFKYINDTYGHKVGDDVLIEMTQLINTNIRQSDFLFRVGGEEFILIYSQTQFPNSFVITEKIREIIEEKLNLIKNHTITVSIGLTEVENNDTEDLIYTRVDKLLYKSKNSGKNKTTY